MRTVQPIANGLSTDHPVPGLGFVVDTHLHLDDPRKIEETGRHRGEGTWGRWDGHLRNADGEPDEWRAFTTDPLNNDLAWCVRFHPEHGRTVLLVRDEDASSLHMDWDEEVLLFRSGGYWWDGTAWYRPLQVIDWASEGFVHRKARAATTVTAANVLDDDTLDPGRATVHIIDSLSQRPEPLAPFTVENWGDHLAQWALQRPAGARSLAECVVSVAAPELAADQLIGTNELAALAGIEPSTLRAYTARGEAELPDPQAVISGRNAWSKPVAADWVEQRSRSTESVADTMVSDNTDNPLASRLSRGEADVLERFTGSFFARLWSAERRKWWVLRRRNEASVRSVADELAWTVASNLDHIIPTEALATTIRYAIIEQFSGDLERDKQLGRGPHEAHFGLVPKIAVMLDWLIRHHPSTAGHTINDIIRMSEERGWGVPRDRILFSLQLAMSLDGKLPKGGYDAFWDKIVPPHGDID
ncbi:hypothetical protein [Nocardia sp. NBC_01388]|uniref:hypothetical protein n=1 Tax=Nocardia sp. NBC_01388 TaxID=2903596 RepID=UPI0032451136